MSIGSSTARLITGTAVMLALSVGCRVSDDAKVARIRQALDSRRERWTECARHRQEAESIVQALQGFSLLQLGPGEREKFDRYRESLRRAADRTCSCATEWRNAVRSELNLYRPLAGDLPNTRNIATQTLAWKTADQWEQENSKALDGKPERGPSLFPLSEQQNVVDRRAADQAWSNRTPISTGIWLVYRMDACY